MPLAHLHLAFVLLTISKCHHSSFRRHRIIDKGAIICTTIGEDHLAEPLEIIVDEFADVKDTVGDISEPISASSMHFIIGKETFIDIGRFEHILAPSCPLALRKLTDMLIPQLLHLSSSSFTLGFGLFRSHLDGL